MAGMACYINILYIKYKKKNKKKIYNYIKSFFVLATSQPGTLIFHLINYLIKYIKNILKFLKKTSKKF